MIAICAPVSFLKNAKAPSVIRVTVTVDQNLVVLRIEAELPHRFDDHRTGLGHAGVEEDVPFLRREQADTTACCENPGKSE